LAGAAGAVTRYAIGLGFGPQRFPWATLLINISGSLLLAFVVTVATEHHLPADLSTAVAVGFLGAYTTYSTFTWETFVMGKGDDPGLASLYVFCSLAGGVAAAWIGYTLARALR